MATRQHTAFTVQQAVEQAPTLARLSQLAAESTARLAAIKPLLPPPLRDAVRAGGMEDDSWCLLVPSSAAAAKLRQMAPTLLEALRARGHAVTALRIKVQRAAS